MTHISDQTDDGERLIFTPYAWAKLQFFARSVTTEIGMMGISKSRDALLVVSDVVLPVQAVNAVHVEFDDMPFNQLVEQLCDPDGERKLHPAQCTRIWIHTHPSFSPQPSHTDEQTFATRWTSQCNWAIMMIVSATHGVYARLTRTDGGLTTSQRLDVVIGWDQEFPAADHKAWSEEVRAKVRVEHTRSVEYPSFETGRAAACLSVSTASRSIPTAAPKKAPKAVSRGKSYGCDDDQLFDDGFSDSYNQWPTKAGTALSQEEAVEQALAALSHGRGVPQSTRQTASMPPVHQSVNSEAFTEIVLFQEHLLAPLSPSARNMLFFTSWTVDSILKYPELLRQLRGCGLQLCGGDSRGQPLFTIPDKAIMAEFCGSNAKTWTPKELFGVTTLWRGLAPDAYKELKRAWVKARRSFTKARSPYFPTKAGKYNQPDRLVPWPYSPTTFEWVDDAEYEYAMEVYSEEVGVSYVGIESVVYDDDTDEAAAGAEAEDEVFAVMRDCAEILDHIVDTCMSLQASGEEGVQAFKEKLADVKTGARSGGWSAALEAVLPFIAAEVFTCNGETRLRRVHSSTSGKMPNLIDQMKNGKVPLPVIAPDDGQQAVTAETDRCKND